MGAETVEGPLVLEENVTHSVLLMNLFMDSQVEIFCSGNSRSPAAKSLT